MTNPERICVGVLSGAFGILGEVRLKSFCADPTDIAAYGPLSTEDGARVFKIKLTRPVAGGFGARLSGVSTKEEADALKGVQLYVDRARLPHLPDDEFYYSDLIGLAVQDTGGAALGKVLAVLNHGAGDILEIAASKGSLLVPFTRWNRWPPPAASP
jgi:16S rRNA processing protein RimM